MKKESGYRFMLRAHGLRSGDVKALRVFEIPDPEACQFLIDNQIRGKEIEGVVQDNRTSRRNAVRRIVSQLLNR